MRRQLGSKPAANVRTRITSGPGKRNMRTKWTVFSGITQELHPLFDRTMEGDELAGIPRKTDRDNAQ